MTNTLELEVKNNILKTAVKWLFLIGTSSFLAYKLISYDSYSAFFNSFNNLTSNHIFAFLTAITLLPLNIYIEAQKWRLLVSKTVLLTTHQAIKAVLAGFSTGFFSPNRIGEMAGRMLFVKPEHRKIIAFYALLNGFTQNLIIAIVGLPAALYFFGSNYASFPIHFQTYLSILGLFLIIAILFFLLLPKIATHKVFQNRIPFLSDLRLFKTSDLLKVGLYTLARFCVFSAQMYLILLFFRVDIRIIEALISIPASYLFITLIPTVAFSEAGVRSSVAVFFVGAFCSNSAGIALAGLLLWLLNFGLPMLVGLKIIAYTK